MNDNNDTMMYIKLYCTLAAIFIFCSISYQALQAQDMKPRPQPVEHLYDFWIGEWEGTWDEGEGKVGKAINKVRWMLDSTVIGENFEIVEGRSAGFKGMSYSMLDRHLGIWKQAWFDNEGSYLDFTGSTDEGHRIMERKLMNKEMNIVHKRMVFYNIKPDSFTWDWEASNDLGKTWELIWRIEYQRTE